MRDETVMIVNHAHYLLAELVSKVLLALRDQKVSPLEGISLGSHGLMFASFLVSLLQSLTPELQTEILYVLKNAKIVVAE